MTPEELFGEPTELLVAETVWLYRRDNGDWPGWEEARAYLMEWKDLSEEEAEERIGEAISREEVEPRIRGLGWWGLELSQDMADRITRRYLAIKSYETEEEAT